MVNAVKYLCLVGAHFHYVKYAKQSAGWQ